MSQEPIQLFHQLCPQPTVDSTAGVGAAYSEYDGNIECEYCTKVVLEQDAYFVEHHVYCSGECYAHDVGF